MPDVKLMTFVDLVKHIIRVNEFRDKYPMYSYTYDMKAQRVFIQSKNNHNLAIGYLSSIEDDSIRFFSVRYYDIYTIEDMTIISAIMNEYLLN